MLAIDPHGGGAAPPPTIHTHAHARAFTPTFVTRWSPGLKASPFVKGHHHQRTRLATSVCPLRHDQMGQGPTEPHTGHSTFLLSSGGAGGGY